MSATQDHTEWQKYQRSIYDRIVESFNVRMEKKDSAKAATLEKGKRPLKMPKDYDFSVKNVNWENYKKDYILRTDAVWEKSKLYDFFYTSYKRRIAYEPVNQEYVVPDIRQMPMPSTEMEVFEDWQPFMGYSNIDGCVFQFKIGPMLQRPTQLSKFVADKEGDTWYICYLSFQKFMICNDRSPIKLDEANLFNRGFFNYPCYDEVEGILDACGGDLFEPMFELYRTRLLSGTIKTPGISRTQQHMDAYGQTRDRKVLHY